MSELLLGLIGGSSALPLDDVQYDTLSKESDDSDDRVNDEEDSYTIREI